MNIKPLHPAHALTLSLFKAKRKLRPIEVGEQSGVPRSVAHNRLEKLRLMGLVDRAYNGNGWEYFKPIKSK